MKDVYIGTLGKGGDGGSGAGLDLGRRMFQQRPEESRGVEGFQPLEGVGVAREVGHGHGGGRQQTRMVARQEPHQSRHHLLTAQQRQTLFVRAQDR